MRSCAAWISDTTFLDKADMPGYIFVSKARDIVQSNLKATLSLRKKKQKYGL